LFKDCEWSVAAPASPVASAKRDANCGGSVAVARLSVCREVPVGESFICGICGVAVANGALAAVVPSSEAAVAACAETDFSVASGNAHPDATTRSSKLEMMGSRIAYVRLVRLA